jgi:hypothetical protein
VLSRPQIIPFGAIYVNRNQRKIYNFESKTPAQSSESERVSPDA